MKPDELVSLAASICTEHKERLRRSIIEVPIGIYHKIFFAFRFEIAPLFQYLCIKGFSCFTNVLKTVRIVNYDFGFV